MQKEIFKLHSRKTNDEIQRNTKPEYEKRSCSKAAPLYETDSKRAMILSAADPFPYFRATPEKVLAEIVSISEIWASTRMTMPSAEEGLVVNT